MAKPAGGNFGTFLLCLPKRTITYRTDTHILDFALGCPSRCIVIFSFWHWYDMERRPAYNILGGWLSNGRNI